MPPRIRSRRTRAPRDREAREGGCFYAAEAVRLAGISGLNYRQLRRLFQIVKGHDLARRRWARFTFRDIVALKVAYSLATGKKTKHANKRLHFAAVEHACDRLRTAYGVDDPLTEVRLKWHGGQIVAQFEGVHFETASGQLLMVAEKVVTNAAEVTWLDAGEQSTLRAHLREELQGLEQRQQRTAKKCRVHPVKVKAALGGS